MDKKKEQSRYSKEKCIVIPYSLQLLDKRKKIQKERKEMRRDGKKEGYLSISFCCSYSHFFFMPPSLCFGY
jgi:hypothetical protein